MRDFYLKEQYVQVFLQGMGVGAGLIMAIGAPNVFVMSQGIRKQYHWLLLIFIGAPGWILGVNQSIILMVPLAGSH